MPLVSTAKRLAAALCTIVAALSTVVALCSCGSCGAESPRESDGEVVGDGADIDSFDPNDVGPQRLIPKESATDPPGIRTRTATERWLHVIALEPTDHGRLFRDPNRLGFVADDDRFYVVTMGLRADDSDPSSQYQLHAIDVDTGAEVWRVSLIEAVWPRGALVDDAGDVVVVANQDGTNGIGLAYKVSRQGELLWQQPIPSAPNDPSARYGVYFAPAMDWDGNYYFVRGLSVTSTDAAGNVRWTLALGTKVSKGCIDGWSGSLFVLDETLWVVGWCGVFSFSLEGEVKVWNKNPETGPTVVYFDAVPLPDGRILAGAVTGFDILSEMGTGQPLLSRTFHFGTDLLVGPDGAFAVHAGGAYVFGFEGLRWEWSMEYGINALIDAHSHLVVQTSRDHVNILDLADGSYVAVYDVGRRVTGEFGVVSRPGQLVVPLNLTRNGLRAAAVSCVEIPGLGLHAPGVWSRRDGNQKNQRRYRTQPQLPAPPAHKGDQ